MIILTNLLLAGILSGAGLIGCAFVAVYREKMNNLLWAVFIALNSVNIGLILYLLQLMGQLR